LRRIGIDRWLRQAQAFLALVFLIWIWGSSEHVRGDLIIASKASAAFGPQGIGVRKLSNPADYEGPLLNGGQLSRGEIEPRHDRHRDALAITNNLWSEWPYISVDPWRLPKLTIPKGHLGGDPSDFTLCITILTIEKSTLSKSFTTGG
jgi:hypothetical protein